jgi:hypothetical protein
MLPMPLTWFNHAGLGRVMDSGRRFTSTFSRPPLFCFLFSSGRFLCLCQFSSLKLALSISSFSPDFIVSSKNDFDDVLQKMTSTVPTVKHVLSPQAPLSWKLHQITVPVPVTGYRSPGTGLSQTQSIFPCGLFCHPMPDDMFHDMLVY